MNPAPYLTRRARNLPLSALNRPRRPSRRIAAARLACLALALTWCALLAWLVIR